METAHSTLGKARTFALILSQLSRWFYKVIFCLLSKGLVCSRLASALFLVVTFLIPVWFWHPQQQNWPEQQLTHQT